MTPAAGLVAPTHRLEAHGLRKAYGSRAVVDGVRLSVESGEVVGLLGPNGAGKTTSFYMIVGLVRPDGGAITIEGRRVERMPIHQRSRLGLSYLPQEPSIFRKLDVEENIRAVLELQVGTASKRGGCASRTARARWSTAFASRCAAARWWACSARTAPARPPAST